MPRKDMSCQELVELVTEYLEGTLSARDRARLEAHLKACDGCTEYLAQMRQTIRFSGQLRPDEIPPEARQALLDVFQRWKAG